MEMQTETCPPPAPLLFSELPLPTDATILVLAPHPDDFDAIGVTLHQLHQRGHPMHLAVLTTGANGIDDGWEGLVDREAKTQVREREQLASCAFFGLAPERVCFLRLWESGDPQSDARDDERLRAHIAAIR